MPFGEECAPRLRLSMHFHRLDTVWTRLGRCSPFCSHPLCCYFGRRRRSNCRGRRTMKLRNQVTPSRKRACATDSCGRGGAGDAGAAGRRTVSKASRHTHNGPGFQVEGVLSSAYDLTGGRRHVQAKGSIDPAFSRAFARAIARRLRGLEGVPIGSNPQLSNRSHSCLPMTTLG